MEGQRERTSSRRRQRRKSKAARGKVTVEPVLIAARRPDSPRLENGFRNVVASAQPKAYITASPSAASESGHGSRNGGDTASSGSGPASSGPASNGSASNGSASNGSVVNGSAIYGLTGAGLGSDVRGADDEDELDEVDGQASRARAAASEPSVGVRRRAVRIVKLGDNLLAPGNREQQLLDRLVRSQGRGAISRAADDLWEGQFVAPKRQEIQIQLLEHENETRARDAVFAMAELLQREAPIKRPVLDQRLRRLETSAEDPITRDAAGALRRSMRVHHGL